MKTSLPFRMRFTQSLQDIILYLSARIISLFGITSIIYTLFLASDTPASRLASYGLYLDQWLTLHPMLSTVIFSSITTFGAILIWGESKKPKKLSLLVIDLSSRGSISISPKLLEQAIIQGLSHLELPKISSIEIAAPDSEALVVRCLFNAQPSPLQESSTRHGIESILRDSIGFEGALTLVIQYFELENRTLPSSTEPQAANLTDTK